MERHRVVIIGAGFAGLGLAIRLRQLGMDDFVILEEKSTLGGTWRDNVYPGVACDVPAHLYSYSFEPNPSWSRFYAPQREILEYLERCADKYGVRPKIRFDASVASTRWDEARLVWRITLSSGATIEARAVVCAVGLGLSRPRWPSFPGLSTFRGKVFHSSRWELDADLRGKVIAVVGTGASAVQIVPQIAPGASRLHLFQRSPPWVLPKVDTPIAPATQDLFRRRPIVQKAVRTGLYWIMEALGSGFTADPRILRLRERFPRRFLEESVPEAELRAKLTPQYRLGCKRILYSSEWYPTLRSSNVEVVTEPVREAREREIVTADGVARAVDVVVCATGFEAAEATVPFVVEGRGGREIDRVWKEGLLAYLGTTVSGFPNLFILVGPNTGLGHSSLVFMMESQYPYVIGALQELASGRVGSLDVKESRARSYNERIQARLEKSVWNTGGCTSWYRTSDGVNTTLWPGFTWEFRLRTRRFDIDAYDQTPA